MRRIILLIFTIFFFVFGCYPVSHIITGDRKEPIDPYTVTIYGDFPLQYEKIAIIEASSDFSLKDPSFDFTHQSKTDKAMERLKNEAALLGANGIVISNLGTQIKQNIHFSKDELSTTNEKIKEIKAIAIFVE